MSPVRRAAPEARRTVRATVALVVAATSAAILVGVLAVGGVFTQSPTATAGEAPSTPRNASGPYLGHQYDGFQLPTLDVDALD